MKDIKGVEIKADAPAKAYMEEFVPGIQKYIPKEISGKIIEEDGKLFFKDAKSEYDHLPLDASSVTHFKLEIVTPTQN